MGQAIAVRRDFTSEEVRQLAKRAKDSSQARRLLAIAAVLDGASRQDADVDAGHHLEQLAGELDCASVRRTKVQLSRTGFGIGDELRDGLDRKRQIYRNEAGGQGAASRSPGRVQSETAQDYDHVEW